MRAGSTGTGADRAAAGAAAAAPAAGPALPPREPAAERAVIAVLLISPAASVLCGSTTSSSSPAIRESVERHDTCAVESGHNTRALTALARELELPVIAAAHSTAGSGRRVGTIEQDADVVIFIDRDEAGTQDDGHGGENGSAPFARLILAKHRNGPNGAVGIRRSGRRHTSERSSAARARRRVTPPTASTRSASGRGGPRTPWRITAS